jgi:hypothetical protein
MAQRFCECQCSLPIKDSRGLPRKWATASCRKWFKALAKLTPTDRKVLRIKETRV